MLLNIRQIGSQVSHAAASSLRLYFLKGKEAEKELIGIDCIFNLGSPLRLKCKSAITQKNMDQRHDDDKHGIFPATASIREEPAITNVCPGGSHQYRYEQKRDEAAIKTEQD